MGVSDMKQRASITTLIFMCSIFAICIACFILGIWVFPAHRLVFLGLALLLCSSIWFFVGIMRLRKAGEQGERKPWWKSPHLMMGSAFGLMGVGYLSGNANVGAAGYLLALVLMLYGVFLLSREVRHTGSRSARS
jgi:hypothetical protein